jgi:hypothetical protein
VNPASSTETGVYAFEGPSQPAWPDLSPVAWDYPVESETRVSRRSWDSPFGASSSRKVSGAFPPGRTHIPFVLPLLPLPKQRAGRAGRGFWASTLARVPGSRRGISTPSTGCSLGFRPSRVYRPKSESRFRPTSSHALLHVPASPCWRRRVSIGFGLDRSADRGKPRVTERSALLGFLHRHNPMRLA